MRRTVRRTLSLLGFVLVVWLVPGVAVAHPLGNFTVNTSAAIVVSPGAVRVDYVLDMAEIPTVQAMPELDADADGIVSGAEGSAWADERAPELLAGLTLTVDGTRVVFEVSASRLELLPGQGGLRTLRLESTFVGETGSAGALAFRDANFTDRVGWHEVTAVGADGVAIEGASVPATSVTDRLRAYPQDLLSSPLDVREATFGFAPGPSAPSIATPSATDPSGPSVRPGVIGGSFAGLIERTGPLMLVALLLALGFGALHALGPGHGKTLMAAYLVGGGGRVRQAFAVGGAVALMHTASVLALGFIVLSATRVFAPERVYPWLGVASGLIALGLGAGLLVVRLGVWSEDRRGQGHPHGDHGLDHGGHDHGDPGHAGHRHPHPMPDAPPLSRRGLMALAVAGGILPSPTALVVLLASVAVHRVVYGMALIAAFSLGLAVALVGVGVLALGARGLVERRMSGRIARLVPVVSAAAIAGLGIVLTVGGASQL
jgi:ABC-type nickel/cobalt efflux system permease component RcnA